MTGNLEKTKNQNKQYVKHIFILTIKVLLSIHYVIETKQQKKGKQKSNSAEIN